MVQSSNALAEFLSGRTPEAMYDALHAGRYLSALALREPDNVMDLLKSTFRSARQRARVMETLTRILASSGFLNEAGEEFAKQPIKPSCGRVPKTAIGRSAAEDSMVETATYIVPDLKLSVCPWCKRPAERYHLLVYERSGVIEFEVRCERCQAAATQFAEMHNNGISRNSILADFGFRSRDAPWPDKS
jgi:hypothetical protein